VNRQIRLVALVAGLMVFALLANLTYFGLARQPSLVADPANIRMVYRDFDRQRGQILAGTTVIAETVPASPDDERFTRQRVYPAGPVFAQITGFFSFVFGTRALENSSNDYLAGTASALWLTSLTDLWKDRTPVGATVQTTIDPQLQQLAMDQLGTAKGAIVVLDPHSGAIKAMASTPTYDPNLLAGHDFTAVQDNWTALINDPNQPMLNRAAREVYPPGSTAKLITAAAALKAGYTPDQMIDTPSAVLLPNSTKQLPNASACGDGQQTFAFALAMSCNTSFANIGRALGPDKLLAQAEAFGFNRTHLDEIGDAPSRYFTDVDPTGNLVASQPDEAQVMMSSIGQWNVAASPLQMAMVVGAIVNGGELMEPHLVENVTSVDQSVLYQHQGQSSRAMEKKDAATLADMMKGVVQDGTGKSARIPNVTMGGKTGTAEWQPGQPPYAWYVAYATDPDVVVAVFIEAAPIEATDTASGKLTGPIVKQIIQATRQR